MANYKVPQDVEADDKILGPFSFRQFIYLIIAMGGLLAGWGLFMLFPPLIIIPLPVVVFFGALALPLRKDQPMEIYLAAILSYYLKPRKRLWDPDGIDSLVNVATPRIVEPERTKGVSSVEADQRLRYLASLSDSRGWSVRGVAGPTNSSLNEDVFNEAQQAQDILDENSSVSRNLDHMISQSDQRRHSEVMNRFQSAAATPQPVIDTEPTIPDPYANLTQPTPPNTTTPQTTPPQPAPGLPVDPVEPKLQFNPYPDSIHQAVIEPLSQQAPVPPPQAQADTSREGPSADIIKLASNTDLSIETIAREAHRINEKKLSSDSDEVVISLR